MDTAVRKFLLLTALAALLAGCASTSITDSWYDPAYQGGPFRRVLVLAVANNVVARRTFEDIFVAKLKAAGVDAIPGYLAMPQNALADESVMRAAVEASGADGFLMVHLLRVQRETRVTTNYAPAPFVGYYGFYSAWVAYPDVYQYDIATAEVNLFQVKGNQLVWAGTTETFNPTNVSKESAGFADVIIRELSRRGLLPPSK